MSTIYKQERHHNNWTGRVSRQSRITGEWSASIHKSRSIPLHGYLVALLVFVVFLLANFL